MKIRIKGNSIRYRLTKTEVDHFCKTGYYEESTSFPEKVLTYALQVKNNIKDLEAGFNADTITLYLPENFSKTWADSDRIGFSHSFTLHNGKALMLLLEKDFTCLDASVEDQSDNYPNPMADKGRP